MRAPAMSLHAPARGEEGRSLSEVIPDRVALGPDEAAARSELGATIQSELKAFSDQLRDEREQSIWNERLVSEDPVSLALLGERYGVSKERIRQIEARIRKRLKAHLSATIGDDLAFEFDMPDEA